MPSIVEFRPNESSIENDPREHLQLLAQIAITLTAIN
jgi:hypothetical protein